MSELKDEKEGERPQRKPYQKPSIKCIALRPQEAVLGACKASGGTVGGGAGGSCNPVSCMSHGS